jgi:hypothetical protein
MSILTSKKFWISTLERAVKTFGESVLSLITVGQAIASFDWLNILSISATATLISVIVNMVTEIGKKENE